MVFDAHGQLTTTIDIHKERWQSAVARQRFNATQHLVDEAFSGGEWH